MTDIRLSRDQIDALITEHRLASIAYELRRGDRQYQRLAAAESALRAQLQEPEGGEG